MLTAGCGAVDDLLDDEKQSPESGSESESPDEELITAALADQERLLATCLGVRARHKSTRQTLAPIVEHHREHIRVLGGEPSNQRDRSRIPSAPGKALRALRQKEAAAAKRRASNAQQAEAGELARVLAAIAASQRQHEYVLDAAIRGGQ